jgi:GNAT superfamily N-acetyltransferase
MIAAMIDPGRSASDLSLAWSYRKLAGYLPLGEVLEAGAVTAIVCGVPVGSFNMCIVTESPGAGDVEAALDWLAERELPYMAWVEETLAQPLRELLGSHGLVAEEWVNPGMVLPASTEPPPTPAGVAVLRVGRAEFERWRGLLVEGGLPTAFAEALFPPALADDPEVALFIGTLDGRPVGTSAAVRTGDVAGVYAVGTIPAARRRGVGEALTWATVAAARDWGCRTVTLQSSEMALPIYTRMGFRTVVSYLNFTG